MNRNRAALLLKNGYDKKTIDKFLTVGEKTSGKYELSIYDGSCSSSALLQLDRHSNHGILIDRMRFDRLDQIEHALEVYRGCFYVLMINDSSNYDRIGAGTVTTDLIRRDIENWTEGGEHV